MDDSTKSQNDILSFSFLHRNSHPKPQA